MNETLEKKKHYVFADAETWNLLKVIIIFIIYSLFAKLSMSWRDLEE